MSLLSALLFLFSFTLIAGYTYNRGSNNPLRKRPQKRLNDGGYNIGDKYNQRAANDVNKQLQYIMSNTGSSANNKEQCDQRGGTWTLLNSYLEKLPLGKADCEARSDSTWGYALDGKGEKECLVKLPEPDCKAAPLTSIDHLGNSEDGKGSKYMWKLPTFPSGQTQKCVYRIKYNKSTDDYDAYNTNSKSNDPKTVGFDGGQKLQLALDTARTFQKLQERSRVFLIKPRDTIFGDENLHGVENVDVKKEVFFRME